MMYILALSVPDEGYSERTWWKLFQKRLVLTKFDIYVLIPADIRKNNIFSNYCLVFDFTESFL